MVMVVLILMFIAIAIAIAIRILTPKHAYPPKFPSLKLPKRQIAKPPTHHPPPYSTAPSILATIRSTNPPILLLCRISNTLTLTCVSR